MKKSEQKAINEFVLNEYRRFLEDYNPYNAVLIGRLRTCNAKVYYENGYYALVSYDTIVAFIDEESGDLFDVLRYVYGYTATSAQHITKFRHDFSSGHHKKWTYRPV